MPYKDMPSYKGYMIDVKPQPLRACEDFTTHFSIHQDSLSEIVTTKPIHMGNKCHSEKAAYEAGLVEAKRIMDSF